MGDPRNKIAKIARDKAEHAAMESFLRALGGGTSLPQTVPEWACRPTCEVCGAKEPYVVGWNYWRPPLYRCAAHLPRWAVYLLENDSRQDAMCNLYSVTKPQDAIRQIFRVQRDLAGNMPPLPAIFPNRTAPVVRAGADGGRELVMMRWGFPPPSIPGSKPRNPYLTNIRNTDSRYWLPWLKKPEHRCLVPVTSFAEPDNRQGPKSVWTWFAQDERRPLMAFAGIWREWEGDRGTKATPDVGKHMVFSFLTTDASPDVAPIHPDATPVLLLDAAARNQWMLTPWEIARDLQRPPPRGALRIVAAREKQDG